MKLELLDKEQYPGKQDTSVHVDTKEPYDGPERRVAQRRCGHDRRAEVRFETGKSDRRMCKDRRAPKTAWDKDRYDLF